MKDKDGLDVIEEIETDD